MNKEIEKILKERFETDSLVSIATIETVVLFS